MKRFVKIGLAPGETKTVSIALDFRAFAYYHPEYKQWITEDGEFDILIGASSADIRATLRHQRRGPFVRKKTHRVQVSLAAALAVRRQSR